MFFGIAIGIAIAIDNSVFHLDDRNLATDTESDSDVPEFR